MTEITENEAWRLERVGYLTASHAADVCARGVKGQKLKAYADMLSLVLAERITGQPQEFIKPTLAMQWGIDHEEEAAQAYMVKTGQIVSGDGKTFIKHSEIAFLGASPDRFVGQDGLLEIKCPNTVTHLERLRTHAIPKEYQMQMQVQLLCTGRRWVDFVDFDPRVEPFNANAVLWIQRYEPTKTELDDTLAKCVDFLEEVSGLEQVLRDYQGE